MRLDFGPLNRAFKAWFLFCDEIWVGNFFHVEIEFIRLNLYIESYKLNLCDVSIHMEITIRVGATWKPSLRDSVSNRNFFKNWNSFNVFTRTVLHSLSLSLPLTPPLSTLCHSVSLSRLSSTLCCVPSHASPSTLCHSPSQRLRHSASPQCLTTLTPPSLWWLSHPSVSSVRYDFVIVWFVHLGLWFLFQSYGFRVLLCLILLYLYFTKKNMWPWCYHTIIIVIWKVDCTATRVHPPFWWIITKKKNVGEDCLK